MSYNAKFCIKIFVGFMLLISVTIFNLLQKI